MSSTQVETKTEGVPENRTLGMIEGTKKTNSKMEGSYRFIRGKSQLGIGTSRDYRKVILTSKWNIICF